MKKSILLLHGFTGNSQSYFLPFLADRYSAHTVFCPSFPDPNTPDIDAWTKVVKELPTKKFDLVVAHSLAGAFAVSLLGRGIIETKALVMISASSGPKNNPYMSSFLRYPLDFETVKKAVPTIVTVQSFDDPWTFPEEGILNVKYTGGYGLFFADKGHFETTDLPQEVLATLDRLLEPAPPAR